MQPFGLDAKQRRELNEIDFSGSMASKSVIVPANSTLTLPPGRYVFTGNDSLGYVTRNLGNRWIIPSGAPFSFISPTEVSNIHPDPIPLQYVSERSDTGCPLYRTINDNGSGLFLIEIEFAARWFVRHYNTSTRATIETFSGAGPVLFSLPVAANQSVFACCNAYL